MQNLTDKCLEDTAIRETKEKLGISPSHIETWTSGNTIVSRGDTSIIPILGRVVPELEAKMFKINKKEVQNVFAIPLEELCDPSALGYTQFRDTYSVPVFLGTNGRIWGISAVMTNMCLSSILPSKAYSHRIRYLPPIKINKTVRK